MSEAPSKPCPKCQKKLLHVERRGQVIELCSGCRGMWFDAGELTMMLEVYKRIEAAGGAGSGFFCVRCADREMKELPFPGTEVVIDACPGCQGVWLDDGELDVLKGFVEVLLPKDDRTLAERARELLGEAEVASEQRFSCPKCQKKLWHVERKGEVIEVCSGCEGMWFDGGELTVILGVYRKVEAATGKDSGVSCIRCGTGLRELPYPNTSIDIDACPDCLGIWLDRGELDELKGKLQDLIPPNQATYGERAQEIFDGLDRGALERARCPKCKQKLVADRSDGVHVERCTGCKGTWLDSGDLTRVLGVSRKIPRKAGEATDVACVRCPGQTLVELPYPRTEVLIDICRDCRGVWLDAGEVEKLQTAVRG